LEEKKTISAKRKSDIFTGRVSENLFQQKKGQGAQREKKVTKNVTTQRQVQGVEVSVITGNSQLPRTGKA